MPSRSVRLDKIPTYLFAEIAQIKREMLAKGEDIIDLGIGDPDLPTPDTIVQYMQRSVQNPAFHRYDESARGFMPFLESASKWYSREYGVSLDPKNELLEVIGSKEGLAHLVWTYCDPGDFVIVPDPGYPVYRVHAEMSGANVHTVKLLEENQFLPKIEDIPIDVAKKAKLFFTCYPNNPTGAIAPLSFYQKAVEFCKEYDILLVTDQAYAQVVYDGYQSPSALQVEGAKEVVIEFHSMSKPFNMTGWRIGFAAGQAEAVQNLGKLKDNIDSKQFAAIAETAAWALENANNSATLEVYKKRRDALVDGLNAAGWEIAKPLATFYVWAKVPTNESSADFSRRLLEESKVLVIPGTGYGPNGEGYVRMSLTVSGDQAGERLEEAARRIAAGGLASIR